MKGGEESVKRKGEERVKVMVRKQGGEIKKGLIEKYRKGLTC